MTWSDLIFFFFLRVVALAHGAQQCFFSCVKRSAKGSNFFLFIVLALGFVTSVQAVHWCSIWKDDPKEVLKKKWSPYAMVRMITLIEETPTHHRHYFRSQDLGSLSAEKNLMAWISSQFLNQKNHRITPFSCFLVHPKEVLSFLSYIDLMICTSCFDIIDHDLRKNFFVIEFHFPFKKRALGLSFSKDPLTHILTVKRAPYLKLVLRRQNTLATFYPISPPHEEEIDGPFLLYLKD
jgi:hypothetical protein